MLLLDWESPGIVLISTQIVADAVARYNSQHHLLFARFHSLFILVW